MNLEMFCQNYIAKRKPYRDDTGRIIWNNVISEVFNLWMVLSLRVTGIDPIFAFKRYLETMLQMAVVHLMIILLQNGFRFSERCNYYCSAF